ncbi:MAG: hypothetical protein RL154_1683 [Pseudomonadota bacterium]|jgi:predicted permease
MNILITIAGIYFFVLLGFSAKRLFNEIHERTLVLISVYFLQPMLAFWGILGKPFEFEDFITPTLYFLISFMGALIGYVLFSKILSNKKDVAIVTATGIIGNTGNLGVPLLIGIYGKSVAFYAILINTANVFVLYIIGVFLYSLGSISAKDSFKNIFKIPVIWFSLLAIILNFAGITLNSSVEKIVEMGAYTSMTLQLIIFGVFIGGLKNVKIDKKILLYGLLNKAIFIPFIAFLILYFIDIEPFLKTVLFLQICMPIAVSNVNLSSLYNCEPHNTTALILASSLIFLFAFFIYAKVF